MQRHPPTPLHTTIQDYAFESSLEFSDGGSLFYKGYKISSRGLSGPSGSEPKSGLSVHDLEFTSEIGKGSSSVVWTAQVLTSPDLLHPHGSPTTVAVKVMHTVHDPDLRRQLFAELQNICPKLQAKPCRNIAKIFDVLYNKDGDRLFIVLEFCNVGSLDRVIKTCGPAPEAMLSVIVRQLFFGLSYLFEAGIQHRDIKPANILMNSKGEVKITDFGSSKADVKSETFCGTTRYMSPERLNGNTYGWQADVWAAGVVMLEAGMGKHPYQAVYGEDCSFVAMLEYTQKPMPQLGENYSESARNFASLCVVENPMLRPSPVQLLPGGESDLSCAHPFIAEHSSLTSISLLPYISRAMSGM